MVEGHANVKMATSLVDYVFRVLGIEYLQRYDLAHVKPEVEEAHPTSQQRSEAARAQAAPAAGAVEAAPASSPTPATNGNGATNGHGTNGAGAVAETVAISVTETHQVSAQLSTMMGDAPTCTTCGHITVRNGSCYRCMNCGTSMGCS